MIHIFIMMVIFPLIALPAWTGEDFVLKVDLRADQIVGDQNLGSLQVDGVGEVKLTARRSGNQIVVQAAKADGTVVGRAESVVGLNETPIYLQTPQGLKKVTILWKVP
jgi:hypothetical protein